MGTTRPSAASPSLADQIHALQIELDALRREQRLVDQFPLLLAVLRVRASYFTVSELFLDATRPGERFEALAALIGHRSRKSLGQCLRQYLEDQAQSSPPPTLWLVQYKSGHKSFWKIETP
jgi:hypothetical protein